MPKISIDISHPVIVTPNLPSEYLTEFWTKMEIKSQNISLPLIGGGGVEGAVVERDS